MPQVIPFIAAGWAAIGAVGSGIAIAGITAGTLIQGAIIGAAIGGLTAAVTGGDIGKGLLFGAVGGAVTAGIGAWGSAGGTAMNQSLLASAPAYSSAGSASVQGAIQASTSGIAAGAAGAGSPGLLAGLGDSAVKGLESTIAEGLIDTGGQMLAGSAAEDMAEKQAALSEKLNVLGLASSEKQTQMQVDASKYASDNTFNTANKQLVESKRQYDVGAQLDAESLARKQGALQQAKAGTAGMLTGNQPSIDQQVMTQEKELVK